MNQKNFIQMKKNEAILQPSTLLEYFNYDSKDGAIYWKKITPPNTVKRGTRAGGVHKLGYRLVKVLGKTYREHRVVWAMHTGQWPENFIDHINGIRNDNRFENLREVTEPENSKNRRKGKNNKTGVNGVHIQNGRYIASIRVQGCLVYLGSFATLQEAAQERNKAEAHYKFHNNHGKNFQ